MNFLDPLFTIIIVVGFLGTALLGFFALYMALTTPMPSTDALSAAPALVRPA